MQSFASDLRGALYSKILTVAATATSWQYWGPVQGYFDRVNVMTYDLSGTWDPYSWHHSALFDQDGQVWSVHLAAARFIGSGVPKSKLGIGIPFFGWRWSGGQLSGVPGQGITGPRQIWVASAPPSRRQVQYQQIAPMITAGNYRWDYFAKSPYLSIDDPVAGYYAFLTFDDEKSVAEKVNFVYNNNLGGWIIWDLSGDYLPTNAVKQPLMDAVKNAMRPAGP
jgi:chitinase